MGLITIFSGWESKPPEPSGGRGGGFNRGVWNFARLCGGSPELDPPQGGKYETAYLCPEELACRFVHEYAARIVDAGENGIVIEIPKANCCKRFHYLLAALRIDHYRLTYRQTPL
jgi:hypothetical protein